MPRELKSVKCTKVDRSTGHAVFVLVSTFEGDNGRIENCYVAKTLSDLTNFRKSVLQLSAGHQDSNSKSSQVLLPDVKEKKPLFPGRRDEKNKTTVDDFCQHVVKLPNNLLKEETVVAFFHDSSAANEDGAIELFKAKDSAGGTKKSNKGNEAKAKQVLHRGDTVTSSSAAQSTQSSSPSSSSTTTTTSSMSPSSAAAAVTTSRLTNVEAAYAEISDIVPGPGPRPSDDLHGRPSISTCEYSEVQPMTMKEGDGRNKRIIFTDDVNNATYDECDAPGTNARQNHLETVELRDRPGRPIAEEALYASVFKAKPTATHPPPHNLPPPQPKHQHQQHQHQHQLQPNQSSSNADELYEDTVGFGPMKREEEPPVLYEDAMCSGTSYHHHHQQHHQHQQPPTPPRPRGQSNTSEKDSKLTGSPTKPPVPSSSASAASSAAAAAAGIPSSSFTPLTPIPPMPQFPSPCLINPDTVQNGVDGERGSSSDVASSSSSSGVDREIEVVAIGDYESSSDNILSFRRGTLASLILQSDSDWWCIRLASAHGWVPAAYWRMLNTGDCASLITRGNSPWFVGKLSRAECETLLMEHGKQQHFVVRESDSGHYALSIKYEGRIHHFPIEVTSDKKYNIGKHDFKSVNNIILYYQKNALFHDEHGRQVTLGSPLVIIKH